MSTPIATRPGTLFVVSAPSGAGKSTLVNALLAREPAISLSISHTTRAPRRGESEGHHYHFVSRDAFQRMVDAGDFFEYAEVLGDMKGTSCSAVLPVLETGRDVLLEIDWQGARQVRAKVPDCQMIFILPPSRAELEHRLRARATDSEAVITRRLHDSRSEMMHAPEFDYIVVNDTFAAAVDDLVAIVRAARLRTCLQRLRRADLLRALIGDGADPDTAAVED